MEYALTLNGLLYNLPALLLLGWVLYRRPEAGLPLVWISYQRVAAGSIDVSGHAAIALAALFALPKWERLLGAFLGALTGWYYFGVWGVRKPFICGLLVGGVIGATSLAGRAILEHASDMTTAASK